MNPSNSTIASATLGAPIAILICWLLQTFAHVEMPTAVSAAVGALTGALAGYFPQGGQAAHVVVNSTQSAGKQGGRVSIGMLVHFAAIASTLALILIGPGGCSLLGVPVPQTMNERVSAAYISVTTVRQEALSLLQAGKITAADAKNIETQADNARSGIDIAKQLDLTNPAQASDRLTAALSVLQALETYLHDH